MNIHKPYTYNRIHHPAWNPQPHPPRNKLHHPANIFLLARYRSRCMSATWQVGICEIQVGHTSIPKSSLLDH
nr:hypothetical protein CFP56_61305 [Quercus suber]